MSSRAGRAVLIPVLMLLVPALAVAVLAATGGLEPGGAGLPDSGRVTRVGLPVARALRDAAAAVTVGLLVLAATVLPGAAGGVPAALGPLRRRALRLATMVGACWAAAGVLVLTLTLSEVAGGPASGWAWLEQLGIFATRSDLGRSLAATALLSGVAAVLAGSATRVTTAGWSALSAVVALLPLALTGHAAGSADHAVAVDAQAGHLLGVAVWVGGLAALLLLRRPLGSALAVVAIRYSRLAGACYVLVAVSGIVGAWVRLGGIESVLRTSYGFLLLAKAVLLVGLGAAGWWQRRRLLPRLGEPGARQVFRRLAALELALMAAATGVAVALSRTSPDDPSSPRRPPTTAESLLGYPMPPPLEAMSWLTQWRVDTIWVPAALLGVGWYLAAAVRLRRRGDRWPLGRTVSWLTGCLMLVVATSGSPGVYGSVLFSMHMVQHMTIAMAVPTFLVLGAPVTLALRTTGRRRDGSYGPREWLLMVIHSRVLRGLGHPVVAPVLFIGSLAVFYYSPLFEIALRTHSGHVLMTAHFLLTGYLFASVIVGIDPGPSRPAYPLRMVTLMATFGFHAFFAVALMSGTELLGRDWFAALGRSWGSTLEQEQYLGGAIGWALGDYPLVILAVAMVNGWIRADAREARRYDRQAGRDGDAALAAHNAHLQQVARRLAEPGPNRPDQATNQGPRQGT